MKLRIGDKVRFLNETGGGFITRFKNKDIAFVEIEDGFELPYEIKYLVSVSIDLIVNKEAENICQFNCGHTFCVICIDTSLKTFRDRNQDVICSLCRAKVKKITFKKQENRDKIQKYL